MQGDTAGNYFVVGLGLW
uniref:Uncharacterized protein n=1 Tax=Anguilla anguilla TaxID=7936 RepID=A0A0E9W1K1_ANGAN